MGRLLDKFLRRTVSGSSLSNSNSTQQDSRSKSKSDSNTKPHYTLKSSKSPHATTATSNRHTQGRYDQTPVRHSRLASTFLGTNVNKAGEIFQSHNYMDSRPASIDIIVREATPLPVPLELDGYEDGYEEEEERFPLPIRRRRVISEADSEDSMNSSEEEEGALPNPYDYDQESQSLFDRDNASDITTATTAISEPESPVSAQGPALIPINSKSNSSFSTTTHPPLFPKHLPYPTLSDIVYDNAAISALLRQREKELEEEKEKEREMRRLEEEERRRGLCDLDLDAGLG